MAIMECKMDYKTLNIYCTKCGKVTVHFAYTCLDCVWGELKFETNKWIPKLEFTVDYEFSTDWAPDTLKILI